MKYPYENYSLSQTRVESKARLLQNKMNFRYFCMGLILLQKIGTGYVKEKLGNEAQKLSDRFLALPMLLLIF